MPSVLAIISKKVFEKQGTKALGSVYPAALYRSSHKALKSLGEGGDLYLVTVRPNERLWLVAVLKEPKQSEEGWAAENKTPMIDISDLRTKIKFESGKGISQKPGALGMSLQTPRALSLSDVVLLKRSMGAEVKPVASDSSKTAKPAGKTASKKRKPSKKRDSPVDRDPVEGIDSVIQYSDGARKHLWPEMAADLKIKKPASRAKLWKWWRIQNNVLLKPADSVGLESEMGRVVEFLKPFEEPAGDLDQTLAALLLTVSFSDNARQYLFTRFSLEQMLDIFVASHAYHRGQRPTRLMLATSDVLRPRVHSFLYEAYLAADEPTRARYEAQVEKAYKSAGMELRLSLLASLQHRTDWANALANTLLALDEIPKSCLGPVVDLLVFTVDDIAICERLLELYVVHASVVNLIPHFREKTVPLLASLLATRAEYPNEQKSIARALACIGTAESAKVLVSFLRKKNVRPFVTEFFARFPAYAEDALADVAAKKTKVAAFAREILENVARSATTQNLEFTSDDEVPEILRNPPWHTADHLKAKRAKKLVLHTLDQPAAMHWPALSRRSWRAERFSSAGIYDSEKTKKFQAALANGEQAYFYANMPASITLPLLTDLPAHVSTWNDVPELVLGFEGPQALD